LHVWIGIHERETHTGIHNSFLDAGIPVIIIDVLCNWYSKLAVAVRWNNVISNWFYVVVG